MTPVLNSVRQQGATLVELVVSIVVISIGLAGVLLVMNRTTQTSADPMVRQQAVAVAEAYLEEILLKPYDESTASGNAEGALGPDAGEVNRTLFNDVNDYHGMANNGCVTTTAACPTLGSCACDHNGDPISSLAGYTVTVQVTATTLNGETAELVQVNVTGPGGTNVDLSGYRTAHF